MHRRMRLRLAVLGWMLASLACPPMASAQDACAVENGDFVCRGKIAVGNPVAEYPGGVSDWGTALTACPQISPLHDPNGSALEGIDGRWILLPDDAAGHAARLAFTSDNEDADLAVGFYDAGCNFLGEGSMWQAARNRPETGYVPHGARYAVPVMLEGRDAAFTLTVATSQPVVYEPPRPKREAVEVRSFEASVTPEPGQETVLLKGHIYVPKERTAPAGTVLSIIPYWNSHVDYGPSGGQHDSPELRFRADHRYLLDAGFALALVNLRGTGISGGACWHWGDQTDISDVGTVIEALSAQGLREGWGNGRVGIYGHSYGGWSGMMGLAAAGQDRAPSLKAVLASAPVIDPWSLETLRGVPQVWQTRHVGKTIYGGYTPTAHRTPAHIAASCFPGDTQAGAPIWKGDRDADYKELDLRRKIREGKRVPSWVISGLWTPIGVTTKGEPHILQFEGLWKLLGGNLRLTLGQWDHAFPTSDRPDFPEQAVRWFKQYLEPSAQVTLPAGVAEYQDDAEAWHSAAQWPPVTAEERWLLSDRRLVRRKDRVADSRHSFTGLDFPCMFTCRDELGDGADDPELTNASETSLPPEAGCAANHVAYVSPALDEDLRMAGNFRLDLSLESTEVDGNVFAYLIESETGECGDPDARVVARAVGDLRHILTEEGRDFPTLEETAVSMLSLPFASTVPAGKRLVLAIGGDGREEVTAPDTWRPEITIHTGEGSQGALKLPVLNGS